MVHDLYIGEEKYPKEYEFDLDLPTSKMLAKVVEALASEKPGAELSIVVYTRRARRKR